MYSLYAVAAALRLRLALVSGNHRERRRRLCIIMSPPPTSRGPEPNSGDDKLYLERFSLDQEPYLRRYRLAIVARPLAGRAVLVHNAATIRLLGAGIFPRACAYTACS